MKVFSVASLLSFITPVGSPWAKKYAINLCSDELINGWLKSYHVPAVGIGIIENNNIKTIKVYGELSKGVIAPLNTIWDIGALAGPVTVLTVLRLVNKGIWNLDEPLSSYFGTNNTQTTRMLLSQQLGYDNLASALENKFGKPLQQLDTEELFMPLAMDDTFPDDPDIAHSARFAKPHNSKYGIYVSRHPEQRGNSLMTTVEDYCKFAVYVLKGAGISRKLQRDIALGWKRIEGLTTGEFALTQSAAGNGATSTVFLLPQSKRGIVIFTNSDNGKMLEQSILNESHLDIASLA